MKLTTLCYIEYKGAYLLLHRTKKENDYNGGKWIGVGGHFETNESPEDCMLREVYEETGIRLTEYRFRAVISFITDCYEQEYMCLYTATCEDAVLTECAEGELKWIPREQVFSLPLWEGDVVFLRLLQERESFFSLKLVYKQDKLMSWKLDGEEAVWLI